MSEVRWTAGGARFIRRGVNDPPTEPAACWVDDGFGLRQPGPAHQAIWRDGEFLKPDGEPLGFRPQFWTTVDSRPAPEAPDKQAMPDLMLKAAAKARLANLKRLGPPEVVAWLDLKGWAYDNPFRSEDEQPGLHLLCACFGTRSTGVICAFLEHLFDLCGTEWDSEANAYTLAENRLRAAMDIITSQRPRNAAEAAHCANLVALHFSAMKLGKNIMAREYPDDRSISTLAKVTQTYGNGLETLNRMRAPRRARRQVIEVHNHKTVTMINGGQHAHLGGGGSVANGDRPDATGAERARARRAAGVPPKRPALPCQDEGREILLQSCGEGEACLPNARGSEGLGRPQGGGERLLPSRRMDSGRHSDSAAGGGDPEEDQAGEA